VSITVAHTCLWDCLLLQLPPGLSPLSNLSYLRKHAMPSASSLLEHENPYIRGIAQEAKRTLQNLPLRHKSDFSLGDDDLNSLCSKLRGMRDAALLEQDDELMVYVDQRAQGMRRSETQLHEGSLHRT